VSFAGNPQFSTKLLRGQMRSLAPWKPFASLRNKDAYTREAFEEDRDRILSFYQDHGYPEARIGARKWRGSANHQATGGGSPGLTPWCKRDCPS